MSMETSFLETHGEARTSSLCESISNQSHAGDQCGGLPQPPGCRCHTPGQAAAHITLLKESPATGEVGADPGQIHLTRGSKSRGCPRPS